MVVVMMIMMICISAGLGEVLENIKASAIQILGHYERKRHKQ